VKLYKNVLRRDRNALVEYIPFAQVDHELLPGSILAVMIWITEINSTNHALYLPVRVLVPATTQ
jgi:hypothetical protein